MRRNAIEAVMGMVVLIIAGLFLFMGIQAGSKNNFAMGKNYIAYFNAVGGLKSGSDVRIGGVPVGQVVSISLDQTRFQARVEIMVDERLSLTSEDQLKIMNDGLLGGVFLDIRPKPPQTDLTQLESGGEMTNTKDLVPLEDLLARAIFIVADQAAQ